MKPTEQLQEEHKAIKLMLKILEAICKRLENKEDIPEENFEKIIEFLKIFVDRCHHGKEEDLLFPAMEEAGIPVEDGPIGVMLTEHNIGRDYVKGMSEAVLRQDFNKFIENARGYVELLEQHIDKEDNILYMIADMHLQESKQKELLQQFEKVERERIGTGKHEEFHKLLHHLKKIYL
ncbi:MAG: hemerythrin domain-containing protein [Candidatus Omnitrophica bacterium]|nr:hemerythrin domain-containing protein [Candidatus Omnitrophota bacterium]